MDSDEELPSDQAAPDTAHDVTLNAWSLRGLAHPLRVRLLSILRTEGAATVSQLAEKAGVHTASASYHLRQLALYGFVAADPRPGRTRERRWKAIHQNTRVRPTEFRDAQSGELLGAYFEGVVTFYAEQTMRAVEEMHLLPAAWQDASTTSDFALQLTAEELGSLVEELFQVARRYRQQGSDHEVEGTLPVILQIQAFPQPGSYVPPPMSATGEVHHA
jgi:predicted ArsR family transcriptional regulator